MLLELSALMALMLSTALLAAWLRHINQQIASTAAQLTRTAEVFSEAGRMKQANDRLAEWQEVTETTIDGSTQAVRAVHKGIAAIPFSILESIPATRDTAKVVREVHDFTSDNVYAAISTVNRLLGDRSRAYLQQPTKAKQALSVEQPAVPKLPRHAEPAKPPIKP